MTAAVVERVRAGSGESVAAALAGSWRQSPLPLDVPFHALRNVLPLLLETGAAGLVWRRLGDSDKSRPEARCLRQAYRHHFLEAAVHEQRIANLSTLLNTAGVEPLLVKGWAVARLYPEPGLRPYGDVDLSVRPEQTRATAAVLAKTAGRCGWVDLHAGVPDLPDRTWRQLIAHSRLAKVGKATVRVLGPEDQLRHLCMHLLRHGAWRPLWLCDVAAALEACSGEFDWAVNVLALACRLLGAEAPTPLLASKARRLGWLPDTVLREWSAEFVSPLDTTPLSRFARDPAGWFREARCRWNLNPIEYLFQLSAPPLPRWPAPAVGLLAMLMRSLRYVRRRGKPVRAPVRPALPRYFDLHPAPHAS